ncbi:hypothetical protein MKEN_00953600 [Mycena kentingensis (nom. inval.)]|nr:hypothetical protein MKEN_00953600 [Mycena kentingensis (nom. inval.)]
MSIRSSSPLGLIKYHSPGLSPAEWNKANPDHEALALFGNPAASALPAMFLGQQVLHETKAVVTLCDEAMQNKAFEARWTALAMADRRRFVLEGLARAESESPRPRIRLYCPKMRVDSLARLDGDPGLMEGHCTLLGHIKRLQALRASQDGFSYVDLSASNVHRDLDYPDVPVSDTGLWFLVVQRSLFTIKTVVHTVCAFMRKQTRVNNLKEELAFRARYEIYLCQYKPCGAKGAKSKWQCSQCHLATYCNRCVSD